MQPATSHNKIVQNKCRCCLQESKLPHKYIIFEDLHMEMFEETMNLLLSTDVRLPQWICSGCIDSLMEAKRFRDMVVAAERKLLQAISNIYSIEPNTSHSVNIKEETEIRDEETNSQHGDEDYMSPSDGELSLDDEDQLKDNTLDESDIKVEPEVCIVKTIGSTVVKRVTREPSCSSNVTNPEVTETSPHRDVEDESKLNRKRKKCIPPTIDKSDSESHTEVDEKKPHIEITIDENPIDERLNKNVGSPANEIDSDNSEKISENGVLPVKQNILEKSREKYLKAYEAFEEWRVGKGANTCSEAVMLSYFMDLSKTRQPATLWSYYSMLKATIKIKCDIHIETYPKLLAFLKRSSEGHKSKKSKIFTSHNIEKFLNDAPDYIFLATKVGLIIGICGACRTSELMNLTVNNIEKHSETLLLVNMLNTKTKPGRSFVIREEYVNTVEKYRALRPANTNTNRFFLQYHKNRCVRQPMGVNKLGAMPKEIATFLQLDEPQMYTEPITPKSIIIEYNKIEARPTPHKWDMSETMLNQITHKTRHTTPTKIRENIIMTLKHSTIVPFRYLYLNEYVCYYCDSGYKQMEELREHTESQHVGKVDDKALLSLMRKRDQKIVNGDISCIKCRICDEQIKTVESLIEHLVNVHRKVYHETGKTSNIILGFHLNSQELKCYLCEKKFDRFTELSSHMNDHSGDYVCHDCGKTFALVGRYNNHKKVHRIKKVLEFQCDYCGMTFKSRNGILGHIQNQHLSGKLKCEQCPKTFPFKAYRKRKEHMIEVHDRKPDRNKTRRIKFTCDICQNGKVYSKYSSLYNHKRSVHDKTENSGLRFLCQICGYAALSPKVLKEHMDVHNGVKSYVCDVCGNSFAKRQTLTVHMRVHMNDKRFACSLCKTAFVQMTSLKYHLKTKHSLTL